MVWLAGKKPDVLPPNYKGQIACPGFVSLIISMSYRHLVAIFTACPRVVDALNTAVRLIIRRGQSARSAFRFDPTRFRYFGSVGRKWPKSP